jgi:hypothetical protein
MNNFIRAAFYPPLVASSTSAWKGKKVPNLSDSRKGTSSEQRKESRATGIFPEVVSQGKPDNVA